MRHSMADDDVTPHRQKSLPEGCKTADRTPESEVDDTLIDWFLSLTPMQRLRAVENYAASASRIRNDRRNSP